MLKQLIKFIALRKNADPQGSAFFYGLLVRIFGFDDFARLHHGASMRKTIHFSNGILEATQELAQQRKPIRLITHRVGIKLVDASQSINQLYDQIEAQESVVGVSMGSGASLHPPTHASNSFSKSAIS